MKDFIGLDKPPDSDRDLCTCSFYLRSPIFGAAIAGQAPRLNGDSLGHSERALFMRRWYLLFILIAFGVAGLGLWFGRNQIMARYYIYQLARAEAGDRDEWIKKIAGLDDAAMPSLIDGLNSGNQQSCDNLAMVLQSLVSRWGLEDSRAVSLAQSLADAFPRMSAPGQEQVLDLERAWFSNQQERVSRSDEITQQAGRLLAHAAPLDTPAVRGMALALATNLLAPNATDPKILDACRKLARAGLKDALLENRVQAIKLAQAPGMNLLGEVVPCLRDSSEAVRRAAILALGPAPEAINDDMLFYWLSDPDPEVRQLCEVALRGRGLQDHHIRLARIMADPRPAVRMQVIETIDQATDLDPGVWLRRLSHDPSPAVRAATARAATSQSQVDLSDRIDQMAQTDPSPTVQQVARYYLSCQRHRPVPSENP
jgi:hypothetical protein